MTTSKLKLAELLETISPQSSTDPNARADERPGRDWEIRRKSREVPFDVLIMCQDQRWAEDELVYDLGAEFAARFQDDRRIFRLKDGRFAALANQVEMTRGAPPWLDIWNWWTHFAMPGITDFAQSSEINAIIKHRKAQTA